MAKRQAMIPPRVTGPIFGPFIPNDSAVGSDVLVEQPSITSVPLPPHLPKSGRNKMFLIDFYFRPKLSRSFQYFLFLSNLALFLLAFFGFPLPHPPSGPRSAQEAPGRSGSFLEHPGGLSKTDTAYATAHESNLASIHLVCTCLSHSAR